MLKLEPTQNLDNLLNSHLNRDRLEFNLSLPGIQVHQENAFYNIFKASLNPDLIQRLALKGSWC